MKHRIEIGTFYITNVCNLTCSHCASFNNLRFKDHFNWADTAKRAERWKDLLEIEEISILGGEPFCHPDLDSWVFGVRKLWPDHTNIRVCTNGTYLSSNIERIIKYLQAGIIIEVSVHDPSQWDKIEQTIEIILKDIKHEKLKRLGVYDLAETKQYKETIIDYSNEYGYPLFKLVEAYEFFPTAIKNIHNSIVSLHQSDAQIAHRNCEIKDCHYFVDGILYKCVTQSVGVFLNQQFNLDDFSKSIIGSTKGIDPFDDLNIVKEKLNQLNNAIKECCLCPEQPLTNIVKIYPLSKTKIRL